MGTEWPFGKDFVEATVHFGISNRNKDLDNLPKPLLDTLQRIYPDFNDNKMYHLDMYKHKVGKDSEFIDIEIRLHDADNYTENYLHSGLPPSGGVQE